MAGPGTHLHCILKRRFHQNFLRGCGCEKLVKEMDEAGPTGCREPATLKRIVKHMRKEAQKRGFFLKVAASLPGAGWPMRQLVLEAIRQAEADEAQSKDEVAKA
jgi:hypothetical protein